MAHPTEVKTLAVDIGGSGIKAMVLDLQGQPLSDRVRVETPQPATPEAVMTALVELVKPLTFDRVSIGFPGVVRRGVTQTAVNLHPDWQGFDLAGVVTDRLTCPTRVCNDADVQGLGVIQGQGVELVITLGTGVGAALFIDGHLVPNLELGHHPFRQGETYEEQLGRATLDVVGKKKWNERLQKAIVVLDRVFNFDCLYIGGGNTKKIEGDLPPRVQIVPNVAGLLGGIALWHDSWDIAPSQPEPLN